MIKRFCIYIFLITLLLIPGESKSQDVFTNQFKAYINSYKKKIIVELSNNGGYAKSIANINAGRFVFVPYFELDASKLAGKKNDFELVDIRKDTANFSYKILLVKDSVFVMPDNNRVPGGILNWVEDFGEKTPGNPFIQMYRYASRNSLQCFGLKVMNRKVGNKGFLILCYVVNRKIKVLGFGGWDKDNKFKIDEFNSIEEYIKASYVSVSNYLSLIQRDSIEKSEYVRHFLEEREKLRKSYFYYEKHFPHDTATILHLFSSELMSLLQIHDSEAIGLDSQILKRIGGDSLTSNKIIVEFMGIDLAPVLEHFLGTNRFKEYISLYKSKRAFEKEVYVDLYGDMEENPVEAAGKVFDNSIY